MDQIRGILEKLDLRQKISIVIAIVLVGGGLFGLARWNRERDFRPLYTGLAAEDAGAVVAKLKETAVEYRVSENGSTILVPSARTAEVRLQMAASGLPKTGRLGYEIFDKTNFGASDFAEQVNYHRALEGELERSVMTLAEVERARVHVTLAKDSVFVDSRQPAKASVLVKLRMGARLAPQNVIAIEHLAASAVEGLTPENVSVLDMNGNLLSKPHTAENPDGMQASDTMLDYRRRIERDLMTKIGSTLDPVLGAEKYRAGISVDCDLTSAEQSEETYDPARSVMVSAQKTEDISGSNSASGIPGTASNLPRPLSRPGSSGSGLTRRTENISYQSSRLVKRTKFPQGGVKRVSVSVILAQNVRWDGVGAKARRVIEPPSPERVKTVRDLVSAAIGLVPERGDQIIVESLPFDPALNSEPPPDPKAAPPAPSPWPPWLPKQFSPVVLGIAAAIILLLLVAVFLLARKRSSRKVLEAETTPALESAPAAEEPTTAKQLEEQLAEQSAEAERQTIEAIQQLKLPKVTTKKAEVLTKHLGEEIKKNPSGMAQVVRSWLSEAES